jgi:hypothetical protein
MRTYCYWIAGEEYAKYAAFSVASVRKADPDAAILVVARDEPWLDWWGNSTAVIKITPGPLMLENLRAQIMGMHHCKNSDEFVFLDVDTVLLRPFPAFHTDLAVTWRRTIRDKAGNMADAGAMPYNYGVLGVKPTLGGFEALYWIRNRIMQMNDRFQQWYGNQLALRHLVGDLGEEPESVRYVHLRDQPVSITLFPCEEWNYTPYDADENLDGKGILHFKGQMKEAMRDFA